MPMAFTSLEEFRHRKVHPGEALSVYVHNLKVLIEQAMPGIDATSRGQLLLHQFLAGIPGHVSQQHFGKPANPNSRFHTTNRSITTQRRANNQLCDDVSFVIKSDIFNANVLIVNQSRILLAVFIVVSGGGALGTIVFLVKQEWGACTSNSSIIPGTFGGVLTDMMLDSGSVVPLIHQDTLSQLKCTFTNLEIPTLHLVAASGDPLPVKAHLMLPVVIGEKSTYVA